GRYRGHIADSRTIPRSTEKCGPGEWGRGKRKLAKSWIRPIPISSVFSPRLFSCSSPRRQQLVQIAAIERLPFDQFRADGFKLASTTQKDHAASFVAFVDQAMDFLVDLLGCLVAVVSFFANKG